VPFDPVEYVVIGFPGNQLGEGIAPAIAELVDHGTVRLLDLVYVRKDADAVVTWSQYEDLQDVAGAIAAIDHETGGLLTAADIEEIAVALAPDTSALVIVWEDRWASGFGQAIQAAGGRLVTGRRIAPELVEAAFADEDAVG
jgi:hypothetical protein